MSFRLATTLALAAALAATSACTRERGPGATALAPSALGAMAKTNGRASLALFMGYDDYAPEAKDNFARMKHAHAELAKVGSGDRLDLWLAGDSGVADDSFRAKVTPGQAWMGAGFEALGEVKTNETPALRDFLAWTERAGRPAASHVAILTHGGQGGVLLDHGGKPEQPTRSMTVQNVARALAKGHTGGRLDSLTLDACMMMTIEVAEALKGVTAVLTGSEDFAMMGAAPWDDIARPLAEGKARTGEAFGAHVAESIVVRGRWGDLNSRTWSALRLDAGFDRLVRDVDRLAGALLDGLKTEPDAIRGAARRLPMFAIMGQYAAHYGDYHQRDLVGFCRALRVGVKAPAVVAAARTVEDDVAKVLLAFHRHPTETMANGLAIHLPADVPADRIAARLKDYRGTAFARHTRWDEFLSALNGAPGRLAAGALALNDASTR
jgi:hypothetical protein